MKYAHKKQKFWILTYAIVSIAVLISSCTKEPVFEKYNVIDSDSEIYIKDGRLTLSSVDILNQMAEEYHNEDVPLQGGRFNTLSSMKYVSLSKSKEILSNPIFYSKSEFDEDPLDIDLVPDEFFSSLLNEKYEIEVGGIIYKVTPYGTFTVASERILELYNILENEDPSINLLSDLSSHDFYTDEVETNLYKIADGIFLFDTFSQKDNRTFEAVTTIEYPLYDDTEDDAKSSKSSTDPYADLHEYRFGAKTIAGQAIQFIIGRNEIKYRTWGSNRRLRVNFYNTNYLVYSALGLSGKFQKSNWIGWSDTDCTEMRIGVQALKFNSFSVPIPQRPPSTNQIIQNHMNPPPGWKPLNSGTFLHLNILGIYSFNVSDTEAAWQASKAIFNFAKSKLGSSLPNDNKVFYTVWVGTGNGKAGMFWGRDEAPPLYNTSGRSHVFSWGTLTVGLSWNGTTWMPNFSGQPITQPVKLQEANVYVTAKYDNKWQGIRIVM